MQEALAVPIAIVLGLFMASYLPWDPPCDPAQDACITAAEWVGLVRFVGPWDEARIVDTLRHGGLEAQPGTGEGIRAHDGSLTVRLFAHDGSGSQTVVYLALQHRVPIEQPLDEERVRAQLRMVLPETEAKLATLRSSFVTQLGWQTAAEDEAIWSVAMERVAGSGELVGIEATT